MPPKKPGRFSCLDGQVNGWSFKVYIDGKVQVGTAAKGQAYERWSFWLTSYERRRRQDGTVCRFRRVVRAARNGHCAEMLVLVNTMIRLPNVIFALVWLSWQGTT